MQKTILAMIMGGALAVAAETPQAFQGTWQGIWQGYGVVNHTEGGSQSSLTLTLTVKADGKLLGTTETSGYQHQPAQENHSRLTLGAPPPHIAPPPPPLPAPPPSGKMLNPRIEGRTLAFEVRGPDAKLVEFRLSLHGPDEATLDVTHSTHAQAYPEFEMKRMQ